MPPARGNGWLVSFLLLSACTTSPSPQSAVDAYASALERRDVDALWDLSSESYRQGRTKEDLARRLEEDPEGARALLERLRGASARVRSETSVVELADGSRVRLEREGGVWRIAEGGYDQLLPAGSPEAVLEAFFRAVEDQRWDAVREAIPDAMRSDFGTDQALEAHVSAIRERIDRARAGLGVLSEGRAVVEGATARIPYGDGLEVRFAREGDTWRVLDLE